MVAAPITQQVRDELPPNELRLLQKTRREQQNGGSYPKPELSDIEDFWKHCQPMFDAYQQQVQAQRDVRYLKDELPPKYQRRMQGVRRFRSRLSHNETLRVAAMLTRNNPKVIVPSGNPKKGEKQARWANALLRQLGKRKTNLSDNIFRQHADALCGDGMGVFELYMLPDSAYDRVDTSAQMVTDKKTGEERFETPAETNKRLDEEYRSAGLPFGLRNVDPMSVYYDPGDDDACPVLIVERKPYRALRKKLGAQGHYDTEGLPEPGTPGWPERNINGTNESGWFSSELATAGANDATSSVMTMRYYDREWYAYIVGGKFVDGPRRHGMPGVPVFITLSMVTSSPNMSERIQGVTWGMKDMELAINDLMTIDLDVRAATSRPKPIVVSSERVQQRATMENEKPRTLDLSSELVPYLAPGQTIVDAFEHLRVRPSGDLIQQMLGFWQRSGLNPIAQGESPGSDPAGYTVNSLTQAAQSQYEVILDNFAATLANIVDFSRKLVRDTIGDTVSLAAPMDSPATKNEPWLELSPDDVDEAGAIVIIDPLSDANKIAKRQSWSQANKDGYISRRRVQVEAYDIDDPDQEDEEIALDAMATDLLQMAIEEAKAEIYGRQQPPPQAPGQGPPPEGAPPQQGGPNSPVILDQHGNPIQNTNRGAQPAPTNAPAVGPTAGPPRIQASTALAGQGTGRAMTGGGP